MFAAALYSSNIQLLSHSHSHPPNNEQLSCGACWPAGKYCNTFCLNCPNLFSLPVTVCVCVCVCLCLCVFQIFEYSLVQKEYTEWSRKLQKQGLHSLWLERDTPVTHITFSLKNPAHIFLHDVFMFCIIDQSLVCEHVFKDTPVRLVDSKSSEHVMLIALSVFQSSQWNVIMMWYYYSYILSSFSHTAPPWSKDFALQSDDTEEPPWARKDQTQSCLQDMQEFQGNIIMPMFGPSHIG